MDDQERFDKLEAERIMQTDPDSFAFYNARKHLKTTKQTLRQTGPKP